MRQKYKHKNNFIALKFNEGVNTKNNDKKRKTE